MASSESAEKPRIHPSSGGRERSSPRRPGVSTPARAAARVSSRSLPRGRRTVSCRPAAVPNGRHQAARRRPSSFEQYVATLLIQPAHATQVRREVSLGHECGSDPLRHPGRMAVVGRPRGDEAGDERPRQNHIGESQRREEHLGESPDVDDAAVGIETLHRGQRAGVVLELAVVVILDQPGPVTARDLEQRQPTRQGQRDSRGVLVRRRDVEEAGGSGAGLGGHRPFAV